MATHTSATIIGSAIRIAGFHPPPPSFHAVRVLNNLFDVFYGGKGRIAGTVKEAATPADIPVARRVRLYHKSAGILVRETWSAADGAYYFDNINQAFEYYVVSFDHTGDYNAVIKDAITPEPMP